MSAPKHTPGPWKSVRSTADGIPELMIKSAGRRVVADVRLFAAGEDNANARLMAAAPEMLDALKLIAKHFQSPELRTVTGQHRNGNPSTVQIEMTMGTVQRIAAAIARTEGRT